MRRTKKEADETRRQILETATDMFIENGFSNTSLTDISHKIGMTKGAVYWHFKNKDDVLLQVVKKNCSLIIQDAVNSLVDPESGDTIFSFYKKVLERPASDKRYAKFHSLMRQNHDWPEDVRPAVFAIFDETLQTERKLVENYITRAQTDGMMRADIEAEKVAVVIASIINGLCMLQTKELLPPEFLKYDRLLFESFSQTLASLKL